MLFFYSSGAVTQGRRIGSRIQQQNKSPCLSRVYIQMYYSLYILHLLCYILHLCYVIFIMLYYFATKSEKRNGESSEFSFHRYIRNFQ
jgi:hypothetical protein